MTTLFAGIKCLAMRATSHIRPLRQPTERFAPAGKCIYCEAGGTLTDEHVIPDGLNGHLVLPAASCDVCQVHINKFETVAMRTSLNLGRARLSIRSKKRKSVRTSASGDGSTFHPISTAMPTLVTVAHYNRRADILTGEFGDDKAAITLRHLDITGIGPIVSCRPGDFTRLIAKIAHSYAVGVLGIDSFRPFLTPHILSDGDPPIPLFLGILPYSAIRPGILHAIDLEVRECATFSLPGLWSLKRLVIVRLQLFASTFDLPVYEVVVGEVLGHATTDVPVP